MRKHRLRSRKKLALGHRDCLVGYRRIRARMGESAVSDEVNSPGHYTVGGIEAIDVIQAKLTPEEFRGYCKGSVLHYLMRSNWKDEHDQDCKKAEWYAKRLAAAIKDDASNGSP